MPLDTDFLADAEDVSYLASPLATCSRIIPNFRPREHQRIISDAVVDAVQGRGPRFIAVSVPPQYGKSTITSVAVPLWIMELHALGIMPGGLCGIVSYEDSLAMTWSSTIRDTIKDNPENFFTQLRVDSKASGYWLNKAGGGVMAVGISGSIQGRSISCLVLDDVTKNIEAAASEKHRDTVWNFWQAIGVGRMQPWTLVIATGTRWSEDDLIGRLLSKEFPGDPEKWRYIRIPATCDDEENDALGRKLGEPILRPQADQTVEEATRELIDVKASISPYMWQTIWQQSPTDPEGAIFFESKWRYWGGNNPKEERYELPANFDQVVMSWDMTFRDTKGSDWVVGTAWGRVEQDYYLLELVRGHWGFTETCSRVNNFAKSIRMKYPQATAVIVEGKANGDAVMDQLRSRVGGLIDFDPGDYGSKLSRYWAVQPYLLGGNLYVPSPSERPWVADFTRELAGVPTGAHDDQADSTAQAILWMQKYNFEPSVVASPADLDDNLFHSRFTQSRRSGII